MDEEILKGEIVNKLKGKKSLKTLLIIIVVLLAIIALNPIALIGAGERGVVLNWGAVSDTILDEGIHFRIPIQQKIIKMDVSTQKEEKDSSASSKDLQIVTTRIAVNYSLDPLKVNLIYQRFKNEQKERVVLPTIEEFVKKTTAKYTAEELITRRQEVKDDLRESIEESLSGSDILVEDIFITDFNFSEQFNLAIESKVTAEQSALEAKNKLEQVKFEAEQKITAAKAEAESIRIQAQAITQQGGKDYVQMKAVEKWDGKLPTQFVPGSAVPFLNLP
jgi:regulator of protease activity HflC (stomatin/prohibitin superfamily)